MQTNAEISAPGPSKILKSWMGGAVLRNVQLDPERSRSGRFRKIRL